MFFPTRYFLRSQPLWNDVESSYSRGGYVNVINMHCFHVISSCGLLVHYSGTSLVVREDKGISNDNISPPPNSKHNGLGDIVRC